MCTSGSPVGIESVSGDIAGMSVYNQVGLESIGQFCDFVLVSCCVHVDIPADVLFLQNGCGEIHLQSLVHHVTDVVVGTLVACRIRASTKQSISVVFL